MIHPRHGVTHAVGSEIEWNMKNGWVIEEEPITKKPLPPVDTTQDLEQLRTKWQAKFGSKPHHKKTAKTLQNELDS